MRILKQSSTAQPLMFLLVLASDHISGATGLTPTVTLSKSGAAFGAPSGAVTEISSGWYKVAGNATDTATLGPLILHATGTGTDPVDIEFEVVAYDPQDAVRLGVTALPNANAAATGGLMILGSNTGTTTLSGPVIFTGGFVANTITGTLTGNVGGFTAGTLTQAFPSNFSSLSINGSGLVVTSAGTITLATTTTNLTNNTPTAGTLTLNNDKTGYSGVITAGTVTAGTVGLVTTTTNLTNLPAITSGTITLVNTTTNLTNNTPTSGTITAGTIGLVTTTTNLTNNVPTSGTITLATTTTNLTNAPTAGDFTATMKTSLGTSVNAQTSGTITLTNTATTLTNLPSIPANWLTAAGIAASAFNGKGDWMVSYTQPTGFLAATFPNGTIASTTNITAGTIATVQTTSNVTNAVLLSNGTGSGQIQLSAGLVTATNGGSSGTTFNATQVQQITDAALAAPTNPTNSAATSLYAIAGIGGIVITPITSTVSSGQVISDSFVAYQNMTQVYTFTFVDGDGDPIDLSAKTVRFTASEPDDLNNPIITHDNAGVGGITIGGTDHNLALLTLDGNDTKVVGFLQYGIENVTDSEAIGSGALSILAISQEL